MLLVPLRQAFKNSSASLCLSHTLPLSLWKKIASCVSPTPPKGDAQIRGLSETPRRSVAGGCSLFLLQLRLKAPEAADLPQSTSLSLCQANMPLVPLQHAVDAVHIWGHRAKAEIGAFSPTFYHFPSPKKDRCLKYVLLLDGKGLYFMIF